MNFTDLAAAIEANVPAAQNITVSDGGDGALKISGSLGSVSSVLQIGPGNRISAHATKVITGFGGGISLPLDYNAVIPIPLPLNAQLHDFQVAADGVRIAATADGITITSSGIQ